MRLSYMIGPFVLLTVLSLIVPSTSTAPHAAVPTSFLESSPQQYVTFLPKVPGGSPSPLIIYPNDTTVWVAGFATGTPTTSQLREYFVNNGTSRGVLNFSNTEITSILVDRNRVWFAENSTLAFYNSTGGRPEIQRTFPGQSLESLVLDHHRRLWMTLVGSNGTSNIVMLNPDNTTRTYPVPTSNALAVGITVAPPPDNTIWFAETGAKKLGRLSCDTCNITETPPPPPSLNIVAPVQVAVDNSGNVWFTDHGDNQFGVFNPNTNTWKVLPIGYCPDSCIGGLPNAIFRGANDTIWFSEHIAGRIANYDPLTGILTEYIIPSNSPLTWWAMPGTNNLVWFVANSLGEIGYVNASIPTPFSLTTTSSDLVVQRGSYHSVPIRVISQGSGILSFGLEPVTNDQESFGITAKIFGTAPPDLQSGTNPQTVTFTISAAWDATLGPRYVSLTASNLQVTISVHIKVVVVDASISYVALGFSSVIILGTFTLYMRRPRKLTVQTVRRNRR